MTIEQQLRALSGGQYVMLIRHFVGKQSDSMIGNFFLFQDRTDKELMINFNSHEMAIIFGVSDIKNIEKLNTDGGIEIIRLKNPSDYLD